MNKFIYSLLAASALCTVGAVAMAVPAVADDATISISLGGVVFGYSDGYYDNDRRWHDWRNDEEREWYQRNHRQSYHQMRRDDDRDNFRRDWREGRRADWRGDRGGSDVSITLGNVQFGYSDGYYDNDRRWHGWRNDEERDWYQRNHRQSYYQMGRYDDRDNYRRDWIGGRRADWRDNRGGISITLGNVEFGYSDGYYDNGRRWHNWRNDEEREWYQRNHRQSYYHIGRYDDRDNYRRDWIGGRRADWRGGRGDLGFSVSLANVVFGYSDGYYDNDRRWHRWRSDNERRWYQQNHRQSYHNMRRNRDRDRNRRDWRDGRRDDWRSSSYGN